MTPLLNLDNLRRDLEEIIREKRLSALFQPIASLHDGEAFGYEGLIRGPSTSFLHSPINLFRCAEQVGILPLLDFACRRAIIESFVAQNLPGRLFLNVSPACLSHPDFHPGATLDILRETGLAPQRVVIELTETQPTHDYELLKEALLHYREMGFRIALDDLGEGFSSLRLWSELKPDFVKIDKYFVQGLAADAQKRQFVRSIQHIALNIGTRVVAEGIETPQELQVVQRIGIAFAQGYHIGKPLAHPPRHIALDLAETPSPALPGQGHRNAGGLLVSVDTVPPSETSETVFARFTEAPQLYAIPVVENQRPLGLLKRHEVLEFFSRPFSHELHGGRECKHLMDRAPLIVEQSMSLQELSQMVTTAERRYLADGFIITQNGHYQGMGTGHDLVRAITELQIRAARYANPLTLLPGNVPIQEKLETLLDESRPFTMAYFDLDYFKPYNDVYGYVRGDDMIRLTGELLMRAADPQTDFVGHIGGDDFVVIFRSGDWHERCEALLEEFAQRVSSFFYAEHLAAGFYEAPDRRGVAQQQPLVTLSAGVVEVEPGQFENHHQIAAAATHAKSMAKQSVGCSLFIERRRQPPEPLPAPIAA
ncbi:diguanylate cyclase (GGDEF)-like protein [Silvimonas terrae]|uniref:Diguanylate cyclase (GGDEF)-like protein n=1 Tax=Silvimonas terrae TaxID=300266 RepID=A0A840RD36_9NEIS|nr:GGDEF domain-containing protein [Silvimonas terrae]MBB5191389.1 diguanylate cyclase (GGDEF)-like protein [Silvimonas terrae]